MKTKRLLVGVVSLFALTSCASVEPEKFAEELSKVEDHTYSSATVKYSSDADFLGVKNKEDGEISYTFGNGQWKTDSKDTNASTYASLLAPLKTSEEVTGSLSVADSYKDKYTVKYYLNPFKVKISYSDTSEQNGTKTKVKLDGVVELNKYGYVTLTDVDLSIKYESDTSSASMYVKGKVTISYKD